MTSFPIVHTPLSLLHNPPYEILSGQAQPYFESPARYHRILAALQPNTPDDTTPSTPFVQHGCFWEMEEVETAWLRDAVERVHGREYLAFLREVYQEWVAEGGSKDAVLPETFLRSDMLLEPDAGPSRSEGAIAKAGRYSFDLSCPITEHTYLAALASTRVALESLKLMVAEPSLPAAFALCRPPGHHASGAPDGVSGDLCGGYCYINSIAVAARYLQDQMKLPKIAILDIDYHHGNGTSKTFYSDPSVLYVSLHGSPDYPYYTGAASEQGAPSARGTNLNFPLPLGTTNEQYLATLLTASEKIIAWQPDFLLVSLGVDTFVDDSLTDLQITLEAYPEMGKLIESIGQRTLFVMEGGYCLEQIGACVKGVLDGFWSARAARG